MLEADYIFLHVLLESGDPGRMSRALTEILRYQNADGSWSIYPGGPGNISLAVKCYFACKLMGMGSENPVLVRAREWILANGGVVACNTFTKIYLCALGQYDYDAVPAIPLALSLRAVKSRQRNGVIIPEIRIPASTANHSPADAARELRFTLLAVAPTNCARSPTRLCSRPQPHQATGLHSHTKGTSGAFLPTTRGPPLITLILA